MIKTFHLLGALMTGGLGVLAGCSIAPTAPLVPPSPLASVPSAPAAVPITPTLVDILWKMATTEREASPEKILPYFGITEVPPVKIVREGYGWFAIDHQPPRFVSIPLHILGVSSLYYAYNQDYSPLRETDLFNIRTVEETECTTPEKVIGTFGQNFKRLPARVRTATVVIPHLQVVTSIPPAAIEKGSLRFESGLFDNRGFITFQFDSKLCAEEIFIHYTRKNK